MRSALPEGTKEAVFAACLAEYQAYYKAHMADKTAPYEGILPLLKRLKESGLRLGVVSNKFDTAVKGFAKDISPAALMRRQEREKPRGFGASLHPIWSLRRRSGLV